MKLSYQKFICVIVLFLVSCSSPKESCNLTDNLCSCDVRSTTLASCADYEGQSVDSAKSDCSSDNGSLTQGSSCPTASRVGTCKINVLGSVEYNRYYSDAITHQASCTLSAMGTGFLGSVDWTSD